MNDTMENETEEVTQVRGWYNKLTSQVTEIDEQLDAGSEAAGKRKFTNDLVDNYKEVWTPAVDHMANSMSQMDPEKQAAAFYGLVRTLSNKFKENVDNWITAQVDAQPKDTTAEVSDEQKKELAEVRQGLVKQIKMIIEMATNFGESSEDNPWPEPKRRGAVGKRGKRALTLFTWSIDGVPVGEENDSVSDVARLLGYEKQADFTAELRNQEVNGKKLDTKTPPDEFTVTLRGKEVYARRLTEEDELEEEDITEPSSTEEE